jgi:Mrp family chromosome partitioning ATPase
MMENSRRVVFTMGGKGGVGKTGIAVALAEWFTANEIPITLLDFDTENKARGSLKHFFMAQSPRSTSIHQPVLTLLSIIWAGTSWADSRLLLCRRRLHVQVVRFLVE